MKKYLILLAFTLISFNSHAFEVSFPAACNIGKDCFVQNYVDHDTSPDYRDYRCGTSSYDKHTGTDIRLPTLKSLERNVAVLAAADGKVRGVRDGEVDISVRKLAPGAVANKECGNGAAIAHADGWETQYCHLKKGSVIVKAGQDVKAGEKIGEIGLSGDTEFPHVHFEVRHNKQVIDPFTGEFKDTACSISNPAKSLWRADLRPLLSYPSTAILGAGFAPAAPTAEDIENENFANPSFTKSTPVMILWMQVMGPQKGDKLALEMKDPAGNILATKEIEMPKSRALQLNYIGKKLTGTWTPGIYKGTVTVLRPENGVYKSILSESREISISQ